MTKLYGLALRALILILGLLAVVGIYHFTRSPVTVVRPLDRPAEVLPPAPVIRGSHIVVGDTTGSLRKVRIAEPENVVAAVTIAPDSTPVELVIRETDTGWFPEITGRVGLRIENLTGAGSTVVTYQKQPILDFQPLRVSMGAGFRSSPSSVVISASWHPIKVGPLHFGGTVTVPPGEPQKMKVLPATSIEVKERLVLSVGTNLKEVSVTLEHRF